VGIYINNLFDTELIKDITYIDNDIETIFIEIKYTLINQITKLVIGCSYRPPNSDCFNLKISEVLTHCKKYKNFNNLLITGDFNSNLNSYQTDDNVNNFLNHMLQASMLPTIYRPTRIANTSETLIDNIYTNIEINNINAKIVCSDVF